VRPSAIPRTARPLNLYLRLHIAEDEMTRRTRASGPAARIDHSPSLATLLAFIILSIYLLSNIGITFFGFFHSFARTRIQFAERTFCQRGLSFSLGFIHLFIRICDFLLVDPVTGISYLFFHLLYPAGYLSYDTIGTLFCSLIFLSPFMTSISFMYCIHLPALTSS
jgi:hypothetical protein